MDRTHVLSITRQAQLLGISRANVYYKPVAASAEDLRRMRRIDELHLELPFTGARMLRDLLVQEGIRIGRKAVGTLMRIVGIDAYSADAGRVFRLMAAPCSGAWRPGESG